MPFVISRSDKTGRSSTDRIFPFCFLCVGNSVLEGGGGISVGFFKKIFLY